MADKAGNRPWRRWDYVREVYGSVTAVDAVDASPAGATCLLGRNPARRGVDVQMIAGRWNRERGDIVVDPSATVSSGGGAARR